MGGGGRVEGASRLIYRVQGLGHLRSLLYINPIFPTAAGWGGVQHILLQKKDNVGAAVERTLKPWTRFHTYRALPRLQSI